MENFLYSRHTRRQDMPKRWHERRRHCEPSASSNFRRDLVRKVRAKENQHLRNAFTNDRLESFEPLMCDKNTANYLYF